MASVKLICCNSPIILEDMPGNYSNNFIGRCEKCGKTYGIEDLTELSDEFGFESDKVVKPNNCEGYSCSTCKALTGFMEDVNCPYIDYDYDLSGGY